MKVSFLSDPDRYAKCQMWTLRKFIRDNVKELKIVSEQNESELIFCHHQQVPITNKPK